MTLWTWFSILVAFCLGYACMWIFAYVRVSPPEWLVRLLVWLWDLKIWRKWRKWK